MPVPAGFMRIFQSTLSVRRATAFTGARRCRQIFQSTLSVRRATGHIVATAPHAHISIHALREESDVIE